METSTVMAPEHYNPNQLVTYKVIEEDIVSYPTVKVTQLEWDLETARQDKKRVQQLRSTLDEIIENLSAENWFSEEYTKADVLAALCQLLGHEPKKHVRIVADVRLEVDYEIPLEEVENFDARDFLQDNISVDSYHGDLDVDLFEVSNADVYED